MPNAPKTPSRNVRVPDERWVAADDAAQKLGIDRSALVNAFLAWFTREPGARLPKRPDVAPDQD